MTDSNAPQPQDTPAVDPSGAALAPAPAQEQPARTPAAEAAPTDPSTEVEVEAAPAPADPPEPLPSFDGTVETATAILDSSEEGRALREEFGESLPEKLEAAQAGVRNFEAAFGKGIREILNTPLAAEDGTAFAPGDDPAALWLAAQLGGEPDAFVDNDLKERASDYIQRGWSLLIEKFPGAKERFAASYTLPNGETIVPAEHPLLGYALARLGRLAGSQDGAVGASPSDPASVQSQIDKLLKESPPGSYDYTDPAFQKKLQALYQQLPSDRPIVGRSQRNL